MVRRRRVREIPIGFRDRSRESSKLGWKRQRELLHCLYRLYVFRLGSVAQALCFGLVGASGFVADVACYLGLQWTGGEHRLARLLSFRPAVSWSWLLPNRADRDRIAAGNLQPASMTMRHRPLLPALFVLLWCTGYLVVGIAMPDAGPVRFLTLRFGSAAVLLAIAAFALRAPWPSRAVDYAHLAVVGLLLHGMGLGGVWIGLDLGVETGVAALVMGTQPLITAGLAIGLIGERIDRRAAAGLALGFLGVILVIHHKLAGAGNPDGLAAVVVAVVAMTLGMLYQKNRCAHIDLVTGTTVQLAFAGVAAFVAAWWMDDRPVEWTPGIFAVLGWSVLVLSIGATLVLYVLLRRGDASRVASLLYLVPPATALMAWIGFGEALAPLSIAGMALTATGVALVAGSGARGDENADRQ